MNNIIKMIGNGILLGIGIVIVLGISYISLKARSTTKNTTDTEPNKLYVGNNETLSSAKWKSLVDKSSKDFPQETLSAGQAGTEQDTGIKWIDGKKIYRKVVNFGLGTKRTDKYVSHGISNLSSIIEYKAICNAGTQYENISNRTTTSIFRIEGANIHMRSSSGTNFSSLDIIAIIYYTKTS